MSTKKGRFPYIFVDSDDFRLDCGGDFLTVYTSGTHTAKHMARTRHSLELAQMEGKNIHEGEKSLSSTEDTSNSSRDDVSIMDEDDDEMIEGIDHFGSFHNTKEMHSSDYTSRFFQRWSLEVSKCLFWLYSWLYPPVWCKSATICFCSFSINSSNKARGVLSILKRK